jgi:hypothetical protein
MKKLILSLGLLGLVLQSNAQIAPRWIEVNPVASTQTPPGFVVENVHTVSDNVMWATLFDPSVPTPPTNSYVRTSNAAGTTFDYNFINSTQNPSFETSNIHGITNLIAVASTFGRAGGGEVLRTTNGRSWTRVTTAAQFTAPDGFNNFVHMFDLAPGQSPATQIGVCLGDPNGAGNTYEILRTTDGGVTWTRVPGPVQGASGEYGLTRAYYARGTTIWAAIGQQASATAPGGISRMLKSSDAGLTWSVVSVPMAGPATDIAFPRCQQWHLQKHIGH